MKIALALVVLVVPSAAHALERNLAGVGSFELHGTFVIPSLDHYTDFLPEQGVVEGTEWTNPSGGGGFSAGIGVARSVGMRLRFDLNAMRYGPNNPFFLDVGADWYLCFGNPDSLLWRPFVGVAFGYQEGNDFLVPRVGLDMLVPLSDAKDAFGFLARAAVEAELGNSFSFTDRVYPMFSLSAGLAIDVY